MKNIKLTKILAFFMAVLMILPMIPTMDLTVFAEGVMAVTTESLQDDIGKIAKINPNPDAGVFSAYQSPAFSDNQQTALRGRDYSADVEFVIIDVYVSDNEIEDSRAVFYKVAVIGGTTVPDFITEYPWIKQRYLWEEDSTYFPLVIEDKNDILKDATTVGRTGYFVKSTIRLYNTAFEVYEYMATSTEVYVAYSFTYNDEWYYWLGGYDFDGGSFCIVKAEDISFIQSSIINTKVILKDLSASVDIYADPRADINDFITVDASTLDGVYKVTGVEYSVQKNILFYSLAPCEYMVWPFGDDYTYISSELLEETDAGIAFPIVDFCNPAPIMSYSMIQPRSSILKSRPFVSAYARSSSVSAIADESSSGALKLSKKVVDNNDGTFTITLEAYTTGTVTVTQTTVPMDIILVLDQSYSMRYCIYCGSQSTSGSCNKAPGGYTPINTPSNPSSSAQYFIKNGDTYTQVYYCSRSSCRCWHNIQSHNSHNNNTKVNIDKLYQKGGNHANRLDALKVAAQAFVDGVYEKSAGPDGQYGTTDDVAHRIAVVGFAKSNAGTEIMTSSYGNSQYVLYNNCNANVYKNSLQPANTTAGQTIISNAVQNVSDDDMSTNSDLGMELATNIYANNPLEEGRQRVTILFTDGSPSQDQNYFMENVANGAIAEAYTQKNTYGATVYAVGIFDGADASDPTSLPGTGSSPAQDNRYMHLVSSNYLSAESMTKTGNPNDLVKDGTQSYYMSASSTEALNSIFVSISGLVGGTTLPLDSSTVVKDIITPQFTLPANASAVSVKQVDCTSYSTTGAVTWGKEEALSSDTVTINQETHSVDVTGFDFAHNYVAEIGRVEGDDTKEGNFHGRKLVIIFTISPDPNFLGGDGVATNGTESGIYSKGECIANFAPGSVSVPLKDIKTELTEKHIYYGNTVDLTDILDLLVDLEDDEEDIRIDVDGVFNAYVDLLYTIKLNDSTIATYYVPAGEVWGSDKCVWTDKTTTSTQVLLQDYLATSDTSFEVTCTMTSINKRDNTKSTDPNSEWVYVYYPTLYFKDSVQKYRDQLVNPDGTTYSDLNAFMMAHWDSVEWKHGTTVANPTIMEGEAPTLSLTFDYATGAFTDNKMNSTKDVPVNVTVKINDVVINDVATFIHMTCSKDNCAYRISDGEFIVHVVGALTTLTIQKVGHNSADPNQTFLFNVAGADADGNPIDVTVTVHEDGSVTIAGLIIGNEYTITEDADWSWRYQYGGVVAEQTTVTVNSTVDYGVKVTLGESNNVITFTNTRLLDKWLDGDSWLDNLFSLFGKN